MELQEEIVELRGHDPTDPAFYLHWDVENFAPTADAIDRLFRRLGWFS